jgi:putative endonuclease
LNDLSGSSSVGRASRLRSGGSQGSLKRMFFVYILYSESKDRYYVGHTENLTVRLAYHNSGRVKSTKNFRPWICVYFEEFETKLVANRRELEIKKKKSRKYLEFLIQNKRE